MATISLLGCAVSREARLTPAQRDLNLQSFDHVWQTIRDRHWDPQLGGLDWPALRDEIRPRVAAAETSSAARAALNELISRLGVSHFAIFPADVYADVDDPDENQPAPATAAIRADPDRSGVIGVQTRIVDLAPVVTRTFPTGAAAKAGVQPGWQIVRIDGQRITPLLERIEKTFAGSTQQPVRLARALNARLRGPVGEPVAVEFLTPDGRAVALQLARTPPAGRRAQLGHLPPQYVLFESRRLGGNIGYITFNMFLDPAYVMGEFEKAMTDFADADGLILDLRGNPGGIGPMAMGVAGWFIHAGNVRLGTMKMRANEIHFAIFPRARTFAGPLAVLIDGGSASTTEILVAGLRDLGRARLFGQPTAGAALPSQIQRLPNGDGFQYAIADYFSTGGARLEGVGVTPDELIEPTRDALRAGRDPVLEAAAAWIERQPCPTADSSRAGSARLLPSHPADTACHAREIRNKLTASADPANHLHSDWRNQCECLNPIEPPSEPRACSAWP